MPRTTLNLDPTVLDELKERAGREGKPLGELVSELLAVELRKEPRPARPFKWPSKSMGARISMDDWPAVKDFLDAEDIAPYQDDGLRENSA